MPTPYSIMKRAASAASLLVFLAACQDSRTPTAPLDMQPRLTQVASNPVVNSLADPGDGTCNDTECTLREAIAFASSGATITFSVTGTILLTNGDLDINTSLTITGPGADQLTVNGNGTGRVFYVATGPSTISGLTITGGNVGNIGGGAGIMNLTTLTVIDCLITGNNAGYSQGAGVRNLSGSNLVLRSSTVSANTGLGGAIFNEATLLVVNSTISGSLHPGGGPINGVHNHAGLVRIISSTIYGNGYGVNTYYSSATTTEIRNSLVWGNSWGDLYEYANGLTTSLGYNLIGTTGSDALTSEFSETGDQTGVTNANLGTLAVNTPGKTPTHALLTGSTAIDAGSCTDHLDATITTDQRGVSRPQGSACDIGAYEKEVSGGSTPTFVFSLSTLPAKTYGDGSFSVAGYVTTNSTGAVMFATGSGSVGCSVTSGGTVTITGAAVDPNACIIQATLAPDATYTGAGPISQSFNIAKAAGSVTISNIPSSAAVGGSFTPTYTKSGDGTASTVSNSTGICTVSSGVVNYIASGTCLLQASVTEGTSHLAATGTEQSFAISLATPTFTFDVSTLGTVTYGNVPFSISGFAYTNSSGYISFATGTGSVGCSVTTGGTVTITGAAVDPSHCIIEATLAADGTYTGAGPISQSFNIAKAAGSVTISNMPSSPTVGSNFTPTFTKLGDGAASVISKTTGVCTVSGGVVSFIAAGTCTLQASVAEGTNHLAATGSDQSVTVFAGAAVFASSCTYTVNPKNSQRQVTVSWENANPGVTQIQVADGRLVTKQLAPTTTGSWSTNVKTGVPTYGLWGGTARRDATTTLVAAGSACTAQ